MNARKSLAMKSSSKVNFHSYQRGFTLVEVMIVVVVIGILSMIAYPSYQEHVRHARRVDCEGTLMNIATIFERMYTSDNKYPTTLPTNLPRCPSDGGAATYTISFATGNTADKYQLKAEPTGSQASDRCGTLTYDSQGVKGQGNGLTTADCWR